MCAGAGSGVGQMPGGGRGVRHAREGGCRKRGGPSLAATLLSSAAIAVLALVPQCALAQSNWTGATSDYNTNTNWANNTVPASSGQSAIFAGTGSATVNVSSAMSPDSWTFNSSSQSYSFTGSAVTFSAATGIVDSASGRTISIANAIGGVGGVTVNDATGTLLLTGANTYSGATTISTGATLKAGSTTAFSSSSAFTVNGTLDLNGNNNSIGSLAGSGIVTNNSGAGTATLTTNGNNQTTTFSGTLLDGTSPLALTVTGNGTLILSGVNTYSGGTTIASGNIQVNDGGSIGTGNVTNNGNLIFNHSDSITFGGNISGTGTVYQSGSGTLTLTGTNSYNGITSIGIGTLAISSDSNVGAGAINLSNGTIAFTASSTITHNFDIVSSGSFDTRANTVTLSGVIAFNSANTSFTKLGSGTLILTGNSTNNFNGPITISAGTLQFGNGGTSGILSGGGNVVINITDNSVLAFDRSDTISGALISGSGSVVQLGSGTLLLSGSNTYSGGTAISAGTLQVTENFSLGSGAVTDNATFNINTPASFTLSNTISGTGVVAISGGGSITLSGTNNYSGGTTVAGGSTLLAANTGALGTGAITDNGTLAISTTNSVTLANAIAGTGTLFVGSGTQTLTGTNSYSGGTTVSAGSTLQVGNGGTSGSLGTGSVTDNGTLTFNRSDSVSLGNVISGSGSLGQTGGTLTLTAANSYTGATTISSGTLALTGSGSIAKSSGVADNGTFDISGITGASTTIAALSGAGVVNLGSKQLTITAGSGAFSGTFSGTGSLEFSGGTSIFATNISHDVIVDAGATLQLGNGGTSGAVLAPVVDNSTLAIDRSDNVTLGLLVNTISGTGNLTQAGTGTLTISSPTNFSAITISAGTLQLTDNGSVASAVITDNRTLLFNVTNSAPAKVLNNSITGSGGVTVTGGGTVYLDGANSYSGSTTVNNGSYLQIDGTFGNGAIIDNGTMLIDRADIVTYANAISGSGTFYQTGAGTLILTGANSFSGNIVIDARFSSPNGILQVGNGGITGSLGSATVTDNGALVFNRGDSITVANAISGTGNLAQSGSGTVILTGANTYSGATTINAGTLQVGSGAATGTLGSGSITDNGTLAFNRSDNVALSTAISGTGNLTQMGAGTLILTAANAYTGTTTISAGGTLQVGSGGTVGTLGSGNVTDNGTLTFAHSDTVTLASIISGTGALTQNGSGTLILNGANSFTGMTTVSSGILEIGDAAHPNASVGGWVSVFSGGTLYGHGIVAGNASILSGGTLRPGGTIGTLTVNGNLSLPAGSTFVAELSPVAADRVNVGGTATLGGNLQLIADPGTYSVGTDFKLISAASVSGTFSSVTGQVPGFANTLQYSATGVDLILSNQPGLSTYLFGTYGTTPNQVAAGNGLAAGAPTGALYTAMAALVGSNTSAVSGTLGQLAGDIRPSLRAAAIEDSRIVRDILLDQLDRDRGGMTVWGAGFGGYGRLASDGNAANLHHDSAGFLAGVDMTVLPDVRVGVDGGYSSNSARAPGSISAASGDSGHIGAYASLHPGDLRFALGGDYGFGSVTINRTAPQLGLVTTASQDQQTAQVFGDLGYRIALNGAGLEPHAGIAHIVATGGGFAETGSIAALSGNEKSDSATYSVLGLRADLAGMALDEDMTLVPRLDLGWQHALARLTPYQTVSYVSAATSFTVLGTPLAQDTATLEAGFDVTVAPSANLFFAYDGSFASTVENHAFRGGLRWTF